MSSKSKIQKQKLFSVIIEICTAVLQAASQLSFEAQDTAFLGVWSVKDLIARR
jgi:hypothetical protein